MFTLLKCFKTVDKIKKPKREKKKEKQQRRQPTKGGLVVLCDLIRIRSPHADRSTNQLVRALEFKTATTPLRPTPSFPLFPPPPFFFFLSCAPCRSRVHFLHVYAQVVAPGEALPTHLALVRPLARVRPHVPRHVRAVFELQQTDLALKGLLPRVDAHVDLEALLGGEGLAADLARKPLLAAVHCALVLPHVPPLAEPFEADAALERLLPRVHAQVSVQGRLVGELLVAHFAHEPVPVLPDVDTGRLLAPKAYPTVATVKHVCIRV